MTHVTTTDLVNSVKRRTSIPISQATFTEQDIIDYLNDELVGVIAPFVMSVREEYFVTYQDFSVTSTTSELDIPSNAMGQRIRDVIIVYNAGGNETYSNLPRLTLETISSNNTNGSFGFYLEANKIKLYPAAGWGNVTIRVYYFRRPGKLVPLTASGKILSINTGTATVTLDFVPPAWTTSNTIDVINHNQPFNSIKTGLSITNISGYDITLSSVAGISSNNYIALSNESPIPQIPEDLHQLLLQGTKLQLLDSLGDSEGYKIASLHYTVLKNSLMNVITPRVDGQGKKVIVKNSVFNRNDNGSTRRY